ncbi:putative gustatory receptor 2a isoform X2 [Drosophila pseudoobscura]|uniref:Gustatory receptor n=1 Tax=Drosophila pseudoobscura pseudoobscura TaxID=46245 RepID=A0A6I8UYU7_DROPS|nr:putative gustatory receptor 2a isoform X2 [Drosophila pseudoobscura]
MDTLRALGPMHRVCQVCNLWQWRLDKESGLLHRSHWLELYGWTVLVAAGGYTAYGLFQESSGSEDSEDIGDAETTISSIGHTVDFIQLVGIRVAHMAALLEALWQRQAQCDFYAELAEIDRQLARDLQMNVDSRQLRRRTTRRAMWMLCGYAASQTLILVAKLLAPRHQFPIYWIQYLLPMFVCGLRYFQIFSAVHIVAQRLELLLDALQTLQLHDSEAEAEAPEASMERLVPVRQLYQKVWILVALLNRSHGLSILLLVGNDFLAITSNCYWIFLNFRQSAASPYDILQIIASAVWSAPHLGNVLVISLICDRAAQCATRLALSLHQVSVDLTNELHNALITQFSLQLLHQRLYFSAAGFFNVDNTLLYTIVGATTTYLIILIQFHMSESTMSNGSSGD